jgi:HAD superfamily hydrolase (TIGR01509 family)
MNQYKILQAVVFDMDGVIIDSHAAHRQAWKAFLQSQGREVSDSDLDYILDGHKRTDILRHYLGQLSEDQLLSYGKQKDDLFRRATPTIKPIPGVHKFLCHLKSQRIATSVATSASKVRTKATLNRLRLTQYFDYVVTGNDVVAGKPDPAIYHLCCDRLLVNPGNALAIEDAVSGIQAARSAGLRCIGMVSHESPAQLRAAGAEHVIRDFRGLSLYRLQDLLLQASPAHFSHSA